MSVKAEERVMVSERIAPGMLPRVIYAISEIAHRSHPAEAEETISDQIHVA